MVNLLFENVMSRAVDFAEAFNKMQEDGSAKELSTKVNIGAKMYRVTVQEVKIKVLK